MLVKLHTMLFGVKSESETMSLEDSLNWHIETAQELDDELEKVKAERDELMEQLEHMRDAANMYCDDALTSARKVYELLDELKELQDAYNELEKVSIGLECDLEKAELKIEALETKLR